MNGNVLNSLVQKEQFLDDQTYCVVEIQKFSNEEFRRSVMFPYLKLRKQNRRWTLKIAIGEELYFYPYPFLFPAAFLRCKNKYDLEMKLQLIECFSRVGLEKRFPLESFLNQFSVSNKEVKNN